VLRLLWELALMETWNRAEFERLQRRLRTGRGSRTRAWALVVVIVALICGR
jgi:hypothetical protein